MAISYKKATTTTLKVKGTLDIDRGIIDVDGEEKSVLTLLSDFDGAFIEITAKFKDEIDLDEPVESDEDEE